MKTAQHFKFFIITTSFLSWSTHTGIKELIQAYAPCFFHIQDNEDEIRTHLLQQQRRPLSSSTTTTSQTTSSDHQKIAYVQTKLKTIFTLSDNDAKNHIIQLINDEQPELVKIALQKTWSSIEYVNLIHASQLYLTAFELFRHRIDIIRQDIIAMFSTYVEQLLSELITHPNESIAIANLSNFQNTTKNNIKIKINKFSNLPQILASLINKQRWQAINVLLNEFDCTITLESLDSIPHETWPSDQITGLMNLFNISENKIKILKYFAQHKINLSECNQAPEFLVIALLENEFDLASELIVHCNVPYKNCYFNYLFKYRSKEYKRYNLVVLLYSKTFTINLDELADQAFYNEDWNLALWFLQAGGQLSNKEKALIFYLNQAKKPLEPSIFYSFFCERGTILPQPLENSHTFELIEIDNKQFITPKWNYSKQVQDALTCLPENFDTFFMTTLNNNAELFLLVFYHALTKNNRQLVCYLLQNINAVLLSQGNTRPILTHDNTVRTLCANCLNENNVTLIVEIFKNLPTQEIFNKALLAIKTRVHGCNDHNARLVLRELVESAHALRHNLHAQKLHNQLTDIKYLC